MTATARSLLSPTPGIRNLDKARTHRAVALLVALALTVACAGTAPDRVAFNTIDDAVTGVHAGMRAFSDVYMAGKATEADRQKVLDAYVKFQAAARTATKLSKEALDPEHRASALKIATDAAFEILKLIEVFSKGGAP